MISRAAVRMNMQVKLRLILYLLMLRGLVIYCTEEHGRGWHVVLCGRLGFSNAQFATEEGATKYMKMCAYAENHDLKF